TLSNLKSIRFIDAYIDFGHVCLLLTESKLNFLPQ
ncbi:MAG: hypothetical protein ACJA13_001753, partial [Paraglaciecola sp.]